MTPAQFIETIYLGDRSCTAMVVDCAAREVKVQVDCISRKRSKHWNFYSDEDLPNGFIVLEGVSNVFWDPSGKIPDDEIVDLRVEPHESGALLFTLTVASGDTSQIALAQVKIAIVAQSIALERADAPGRRIRD